MNFQELEEISYEIGKCLALNNYIVVNGGKSGIMKHVSRGVKENGGITVGVIKGNKRGKVNEYIDVEVVSNILDGGDALIIPNMCDGAIVVGGGVGTLAEITGFYRIGKPIVALENAGGRGEKLINTYLDERKTVKIEGAGSAENAVSSIIERINKELLNGLKLIFLLMGKCY